MEQAGDNNKICYMSEDALKAILEASGLQFEDSGDSAINRPAKNDGCKLVSKQDIPEDSLINLSGEGQFRFGPPVTDGSDNKSV